MIKHIVMWRLKEFAEGCSAAENAQKIKAKLEALLPIIKEIKALEVGINFNPSDMAYNLVLYSEFASKEDLQTYQKHPEHLKVSDFVAKVRNERAVVDYEAK